MNFSQKSLDFMAENRLRNSREWFHEHRGEYEEFVLEPMCELVESLTPFILSVDDSLICVPKIGKSISHINRDTRFSKDKLLYRANIWCVFMRDKKLYDGMPGFYVDISCEGLDLGCGWYKTSTQTNEAIRSLILSDDKAWKAAKRAFDRQDVFTMYGDRFKRSRYPEQSEAKREWLDLRNYGVSASFDDLQLVFSDDLASFVTGSFTKIVPVYSFFAKAQTKADAAVNGASRRI